jgi:hypothetical protein
VTCLVAGEELTPGTPHKPLPADAGESTIALLEKLRNSKGSLHTSQVCLSVCNREAAQLKGLAAHIAGRTVCLSPRCTNRGSVPHSFVCPSVHVRLPKSKGSFGLAPLYP